MWRGLRDRLFGSDDDDAVERLHDELDQLRDHVLHDDDREREQPLERQVDALEAHIEELRDELRQNREALEHVVEALSHSAEKQAAIENLEERLHTLEQHLSNVDPLTRENLSNPSKPGKETSRRTSSSTSERSEGESGRAGGAVETARAVERGKRLWEKATPAQRSILQTLYDAGYPMSYKEIANDVGRSVSTVKNHINNLKSAGFDFKEDAGYNNTKKYMLDETVKAFLTVRLND
ncbi:MAG: winged helix-turn-helix transcriptional regulator [Candidatus Nanohaloarchaea archaeon]|nr:winged helix-turn-helix transcriptional regulator [Candidatus Nanohaloarchaea archaeon]